MSRTIFARYVAPWKYRREVERERVAELRKRDGDDCRRCRRPLRFDLPEGHDAGPRIEPIGADGGGEPLDSLGLCHRRCNAPGIDHTDEVAERIRRKAEAELLSKSRKRGKKAA